MNHTPLTDQQLKELEALAKNVPAGPWTYFDSDAELRGSHGNLLADLWDDRLGAYFTAMHAATQPLLDEVRRMRQQRKFLLNQIAKRDAASGKGDKALAEFLAAEPQAEADTETDRPAAEQAEACGKCKRPFNPADPRWDGSARYAETPYCRRCIDGCHESTDAFHRCVICQ